MNSLQIVRRAGLGVALSVVAGLSVARVRAEALLIELFPGWERVRTFGEKVGRLPEVPPMRFKKLFTLPVQGWGRGFELVQFSPDGKVLAATRSGGYENPDVVVWNLDKRQVMHVLPHAEKPEQLVSALAFVPPGDRLVTACEMLKKFFLWDVRSGNRLQTLDTGGRPETGFSGGIGLAAFPDGNRVLCCTSKGPIVWDLERKTHTTLPLGEYGRGCCGVAFTADGSRFVARVDDVAISSYEILLADAKTYRVARHIPSRLSGTFPLLAFAPDGGFVAANYYQPYYKSDPASGESGEGAVVAVWDAASGNEVLAGRPFGVAPRGMVYTRDGKYLLILGQRSGPPLNQDLAGAAGPSVVGVWDVATGRVVNEVFPGGHVAISSDNKLLAVAAGRIDIYAIEYAEQAKGK
jgi:WD40 repeat protein